MSDFEQLVPGLEPVLTTSEVASHLGVPVQTIHDPRHSSRDPRGFRVGRELRYRVSEVRDWLSDLEEAAERRSTHDGSDRWTPDAAGWRSAHTVTSTPSARPRVKSGQRPATETGTAKFAR
jgi:predicted DNA-binding transcriptional regulator AlpA